MSSPPPPSSSMPPPPAPMAPPSLSSFVSSMPPPPAPMAPPSLSSSSSSMPPPPATMAPPSLSSSLSFMPPAPAPMAPPPPAKATPPLSSATPAASVAATGTEQAVSSRTERPYTIPEWSHEPGKPYKLEVLKEGSILESLEVSEKGAYMFGRHDSADFILDHPSISRYHAVLQYNSRGEAFLYDLGSTHGSFINKRKVKPKVHVPLHVGDMIRFGMSSRFYILQGPQELMPQEGLLKEDRKRLRQLEAIQSKADEEASLLRSKVEAANTDGVTWGMDADAIEEEIRDEEEITWQTYKGQLNEKQQKNLEQITKRNEKLTNLKKEIDAIQAKETAQGGLTQGQQTQIARNEKRIEELLEQLDNLEETLNESIRESVLGRKRTTKERQKRFQEEDGDMSDDDDFYDRTKKKQKKESQEAESANSLLERREHLVKEMEDLAEKMKKAEEEKAQSGNEDEAPKEQTLDPLDAFMTGVSTEIVEDSAVRLQREMERLRGEAERVARLLKVADPTGEAMRKWQNRNAGAALLENASEAEVRANAETGANMVAGDEPPQEPATTNDGPLWIGAPREAQPVEPKLKPLEDDPTTDNFIHYKDRAKKLGKEAEQPKQEKKKDTTVADDIALLLKHKQGLADDFEADASNTAKKDKKKRRKAKGKRTLGPDRPDFLNDDERGQFESWVPPEGQTGDGRTSLNEKLGY